MSGFRHPTPRSKGAMKKLEGFNYKMKKLERVNERALSMKNRKEKVVIWLLVRAVEVQRHQEPLTCSYHLVPKVTNLWSEKYEPPLGYFSSKDSAEEKCTEMNKDYGNFVVLELEQE